MSEIPSVETHSGPSPNTWAMIVHLSGLTGYLCNGFGSVIAPLVIWLWKKDEVPIVDEHGKESLNFNISVMIYAMILAGITVATFGFALILTGPAFFILAAFHLVCVIVATVRANRGEPFQYPLTIRFIK
jgi:uncharacterized Tic20 family protein